MAMANLYSPAVALEFFKLAGKSVIGTIARGGIFGEMASITHAPHSASAVAKSACGC